MKIPFISQLAKFANKNKAAKAPVKEEGVVYVSVNGNYYSEPEITADKVIDLMDNVYVRGIISKQLNLIFQDKYTIEVRDANGAVDVELGKTISQFLETKSVRLWARMQQAYIDWFFWGIGLYNPVWGTDEQAQVKDIRLLKLRHLPPESFKTEPSGVTETYSPLLPGIILNDKKEMEFYQEPKKDDTPVLLKNVFYTRNPTDRGVAGDAIIIPIIPILEMLKFTWNTQMQQVNRVGAKILFLKVTKPKPATTENGNISDIDYANAILKNWGKDTAFPLRENMEPIDLKLTDDSSNLEIINALNDLLIDYVTPANFIGSDQTTRLGGNETAQKELLDNYIIGKQQATAEQFEMLVMRYFEYNQYYGYSLKIKIPPPTHDSREDNRNDAFTGFSVQALSKNELRKLLKHEELDEAGLKELAKEYEGIQPNIKRE